jgi:hypothetical protein
MGDYTIDEYQVLAAIVAAYLARNKKVNKDLDAWIKKSHPEVISYIFVREGICNEHYKHNKEVKNTLEALKNVKHAKLLEFVAHQSGDLLSNVLMPVLEVQIDAAKKTCKYIKEDREGAVEEVFTNLVNALGPTGVPVVPPHNNAHDFGGGGRRDMRGGSRVTHGVTDVIEMVKAAITAGVANLDDEDRANLVNGISVLTVGMPERLFKDAIRLIRAFDQLNGTGAAAASATTSSAFDLTGAKYTIVIVHGTSPHAPHRVIVRNKQNAKDEVDDAVIPIPGPSECGRYGVNHVGSNGREQCQYVITRCTTGDRNTCIEAVANSLGEDADILTEEKLVEINPIYIRDFLNKVDYPVVSARNGSTIRNSYDTYDQFMERMKASAPIAHAWLTADSPNNKQKAARFRNLINRLVSYINRQYPQLLNLQEVYDKQQGMTGGPGVKRADRTTISYPMPLPVATRPGDITKLMLPGIMQIRSGLVKTALSPFMLIGARGLQSGGAFGFNNNMTQLVETTTEYYDKGIHKLIESIEKTGKRLDDKSLTGIEDRLNKFKEAGKEFAEKYDIVRDYVETNARNRDPNLNIDLSKMKEHTERYKIISDKYIKSESLIVDLISKLHNLVVLGAGIKIRP